LQAKPEEYLSKLDSLARFYNSQLTAHVGYLISISALVGALFLTLLSSVVLNLDFPESWRVATILVMTIGLLLYVLGDFIPYVSFPYLYARTAFYSALSDLTWEHMGLKTPMFDAELVKLRERATRIGAEYAIVTMFQARLFVSRCLSKGFKDKIARSLDAFLIEPKEMTLFPLDDKHRYYNQDLPFPLAILWRRYVDMYWSAYKHSCPALPARNGRLLRLDFSDEKGSTSGVQ
jgi:hypothetical protein